MDDPHDEVMPPRPDMAGWCHHCNEEFETCQCGRDVPYGMGLIYLSVIMTMLAFALLIWLFS